ncbi:MAG TPA: family 20 glycosylhydrolase [Candidatus Angelobacter sp.]|nr:family 20 glycosylhydrolase [Candidatus Angelobacter sp.]
MNRRRLHVLGLFSALGLMSSAMAQGDPTLPLMPMPSVVRPGTGKFIIDQSFTIAMTGPCGAVITRATERMVHNLARRTGLPLAEAAMVRTSDKSKARFTIHCTSPEENLSLSGPSESYVLEVKPSGVRLEAQHVAGLLHGMQTFLQLVQMDGAVSSAPAVTIEDSPRFPWRGLMIDVARHFIPLDVLKRNLDGMEAVKLNVLHWHLSDDQGFRVESKKFPKFQQLASDGKFYTQAEVHELIEYAQDRGIRVVPEFDMPGHTTSWFAAYPELASAPGPHSIERKWGVFDAAMDPSSETTYRFLDTFIGEMAVLFPDAYFHIGGDEVTGKQWDRNPKIQEFMRRNGLKNNHDLQAYFNRRLAEIVKKHEKIMIGWDEVLYPGLPVDTVVQSWRGQKSLAEAARRGYSGLLSHGYYLDLMYSAAQHYSPDPLGDEATSLTAQEKQKIFGGEACMWTEFADANNLDNRIWPRLAAEAERLWSPQELRDPESMYRRLAILSKELEALGLRHNAVYFETLQRLAGGNNTEALQMLADVLEPVKAYVRHRNKDYESSTPLDRLVDGIHPESDTAREFAGMVNRLIKDPSDARQAAAILKWLTLWRDNDQKLEPALQSNPLLKELPPLSKNLSSAAAAGLQAMDYLSAGGHAPAAWREQQLALLKQAEKPQAEMLNMIVPSMRKLVEATLPQ